MIKAVIVGRTIEELNMYFELIGQSLEEDIIENRTKERIIMKNNDSYHTIIISNIPRCCRCDRLYINKYIDKNILKKYIYPMVRFSSLPLNERIIEWEAES